MGENVEYAIYPEMHAGGYSRVDHRMEYIARVNSLLTKDMVVMDFGAGRGKWIHDPAPLRRELGDFRGRCRRVIGADVDPAILENPQVDERIHLGIDEPVPLPDASIDLLTAFSVFEHVENGEFYAAEFARLIRPGGWLCAWTPNRWGYVAVGATLVPKSLHRWALRRLEPRREDSDSFPPVYHMNTRPTLRRLFPPDQWDDHTYYYNGQPFYHMERPAVARFWQMVFWAAPAPLSGFLMIFMQRKPTAGPDGAGKASAS